MTRQTALELIRHRDQLRTLAVAGRITDTDRRALADLEQRARREEGDRRG